MKEHGKQFKNFMQQLIREIKRSQPKLYNLKDHISQQSADIKKLQKQLDLLNKELENQRLI